MIKIYHNPRCSKSREGLSIVEESGKGFEVIPYMKAPLSKEELQQLLHLLAIPAEALVRKNEKVWKEKYKGKTLSEEEIITAMVQHPNLIERPIVIHGNKAVIGRPPEKISDILD